MENTFINKSGNFVVVDPQYLPDSELKNLKPVSEIVPPDGFEVTEAAAKAKAEAEAAAKAEAEAEAAAKAEADKLLE